ncbi:MAG: hypothetical protein RI907_359 [Pseudomonadota bacterium]|jgi:hypothetical protein
MNIKTIAALATALIATTAVAGTAKDKKCGAGSCSKKAAHAASGASEAEAKCSKKEAGCSKKASDAEAKCSKKEAACSKK